MWIHLSLYGSVNVVGSLLVIIIVVGCVEEFFSQPGVVICFDLNFGQ